MFLWVFGLATLYTRFVFAVERIREEKVSPRTAKGLDGEFLRPLLNRPTGGARASAKYIRGERDSQEYRQTNAVTQTVYKGEPAEKRRRMEVYGTEV